MLPSSLGRFGPASLIQFETGPGLMSLAASFAPVAAAVALTWFVINKAMIGRGVAALANSEESAIRAGFRPLAIRLFVHAYMGALAGIVGVMYVSKFAQLIRTGLSAAN